MSAIAREAALAAGLKVYNGKPCMYGHKGIRGVKNNICIECASAEMHRLHERRRAGLRAVVYEYLALACYGMKNAEIAKRYGVTEKNVAVTTLRAARKVGRMGFWKFHVSNRDELRVLSQKILAKMDKHGLSVQMKEAA